MKSCVAFRCCVGVSLFIGLTFLNSGTIDKGTTNKLLGAGAPANLAPCPKRQELLQDALSRLKFPQSGKKETPYAVDKEALH